MRGSSNPAAPSDSFERGMRAGAADLGEVIAYLAGGIRPDPDTLSRLLLTLRQMQDFLNAVANLGLPDPGLTGDLDAREVA